ncbi:MAG: hypothetical protein JWM95_4859 [Gemmatimonadetes bacterium]|nr:hypothetical protein [Gemmatimonadota bacterium]
MRRMRLSALLLLIMSTQAGTMLAQQVRGSVKDSARAAPIAGAVVILLDSLGRTVGRSTTDQQGSYRVTARDARRIRVLRIGFRPQERALPSAAEPVDVTLASIPLLLGEVHVNAPASCPARSDRTAALALLEQVRAGLLSTIVARSQNRATMTLLVFDRRFEGGSERILSQSVRTTTGIASTEPFVAGRSTADFIRYGFRDDVAGSQTFFGPDAQTLIDDTFATGYCFHVMEPEHARPHQIGLGFEAAQRKDGKIDIAGALWVDTLARALKMLEFRYVGLDRSVSALRPGGTVTFSEVSNGVVLIDRWSLRLIAGRAESGGMTLSSTGEVSGGRTSRLNVQETGGELARAAWPGGDSFVAPLGTLRIHVVARNGDRAPAGTTVRLVDTDYEGIADSTGTIEIADLLPGPYTISIVDSTLSTLGIPLVTASRIVAMRDSTMDMRLEMERAEDFVAKRCQRDERITGNAWVLGRVVTSNGAPVRDAEWKIRDPYGSSLVEGKVGSDGVFQWCQLPLSKTIEIEVWKGERRLKETRVLVGRLATFRFELPP